MKNKLDLSIIIVNFNTKKITRECIESLIKTTKNISYEIIVVDNASDDGSVEALNKLKTRNSNLGLILNKKNLGFGKGNNQGLKVAKGRYLLLLNTDTMFSSNVLGEMVSWMDNHEMVGAASCALKNRDGSLQGTGGYFPHLFKIFAWMFFLEDIPLLDRLIRPFHPMHGQSPFYKGEGQFKTAHEKDWLTGAFFLIRKEVVDEIGYIAEDYFMYTEEVDYCYRIKQKGWKIWYLPKWSIVHYGGASSTAEFPILSEYKGIKIFYKKHKPSWQTPVLRMFLKSGAFLRIILFGILKGKEAAKTYAKAFKEA